MTTFPMEYTSGSITPDMWQAHPGGVKGFLRELGQRLPDQLLVTARANYGLRLVHKGRIRVEIRSETVPPGPGSAGYEIYRMVASADFTPTRCIAEYTFHVHPHSHDCLLARMA